MAPADMRSWMRWDGIIARAPSFSLVFWCPLSMLAVWFFLPLRDRTDAPKKSCSVYKLSGGFPPGRMGLWVPPGPAWGGVGMVCSRDDMGNDDATQTKKCQGPTGTGD
jgi:hypothetical protein